MFCKLPSNTEASSGSTIVAIGEEVNIYCSKGYKLSNSLQSLPALCGCGGNWNITTDRSLCEIGKEWQILYVHVCGNVWLCTFLDVLSRYLFVTFRLLS